MFKNMLNSLEWARQIYVKKGARELNKLLNYHLYQSKLKFKGSKWQKK